MMLGLRLVIVVIVLLLEVMVVIICRLGLLVTSRASFLCMIVRLLVIIMAATRGILT